MQCTLKMIMSPVMKSSHFPPMTGRFWEHRNEHLGSLTGKEISLSYSRQSHSDCSRRNSIIRLQLTFIITRHQDNNLYYSYEIPHRETTDLAFSSNGTIHTQTIERGKSHKWNWSIRLPNNHAHSASSVCSCDVSAPNHSFSANPINGTSSILNPTHLAGTS
jgi:hypothetical protein